MNDDFLVVEEAEEQPVGAVGWLEVPKPPPLPSDPREKVLAVTAYLETVGMSLADLALVHPKWFYSQFLKTLIPKESKVEMKAEVLNEIQIDARIQHLVSVLGPEVLEKYVPGIGAARAGITVGGEEQAAVADEDLDILS